MTPAPRARIWTVPLILAALMAAGLTGALVADGVWGNLASAALGGAPLYAIDRGVVSGSDR